MIIVGWVQSRWRRLLLLICGAALAIAGLVGYAGSDLSWAAFGQELLQRWPFSRYEIRVRFQGVIEGREGDIWYIGGQKVRVPSALQGGQVAAMVPGQRVWVRAMRKADGSLVAESVSIAEEQGPWEGLEYATDEMRATVEFEGTISRLPAGKSYIGSWMVENIEVIVDADTRIQGIPRLGANVEIMGFEEGPLRMRAQRIWIVADEEQSLLLRGVIAAWGGKGALSRERALDLRKSNGAADQVRVDEHTFIDESGGRVEVGAWAEIRAIRRNDGSLWAQYIRIRRP